MKKIGVHSIIFMILLSACHCASGCATADRRVAQAGADGGWGAAFSQRVDTIAVAELRLPVKATVARRESSLRHKG